MPTEEQIKISKVDELIRVLVVDETPQKWRLWKGFTRFLSRQNDLALRIYATLLEKKEKTSSRDIASQVNASLYSVRRALGDLYDLKLVSRERYERGHLTFDYWSIKTQVLGILRLIPENYFQDGYPKKQPKSK